MNAHAGHYMEALRTFQRRYFSGLLTLHHGEVTKVAEHAGVERTHLYRRLKALGIDLADFREGAACGS